MEKTYTLTVRVVNSKENNPIKNVNIKVFRIEKEITLKQWGENLKNGSPFERLVLSMNTNNDGSLIVELPEDCYEVKAEEYGLTKACELKQNVEILFVVASKKRWWKSS